MLDASPVQVRPRRDTTGRVPYLFDLPSASRLIEIAAALPDSRRATLRAPYVHDDLRIVIWSRPTLRRSCAVDPSGCRSPSAAAGHPRDEVRQISACPIWSINGGSARRLYPVERTEVEEADRGGTNFFVHVWSPHSSSCYKSDLP